MKYTISLFFLIFFSLPAMGQDEAYTIRKAPLSSEMYNEFSPVLYRNGMVFCTDRGQGLTNYSDGQNRSPFKINYIDTTGKVKWNDAGLFSKDLTTRLNEGPVTFSRNGDTIYFSRNLNIDPKISKLLGMRNKLGIFSAALVDGKWINIKEFRHNIEWYNVTTPCLSPDGKRLYFSSDQQGGSGGMDLYYSQWKNGYWDTPVNLGPVINTRGNEGYPFMNEAGELFFSSDGHKGMGGQDIFVTKQGTKGWYAPVRLEAPLNSESDDFGILTDRMADKGYFSSNRGKTFDIYHFDANRFHFWFAAAQKENKYCFCASDTGKIEVDTTKLRYVWNFGDGTKLNGSRVTHYYRAPGAYSINLDIIDRKTGNLFFNKLRYEVEVINTDQPFINSPGIALKGETVEFDGLKSYTPGFTVIGYYWDFGDGKFGSGERVNHVYFSDGEYEVRLGLILRSDSDGDPVRRVVAKKIRILAVIRENEIRIPGNSGQNGNATCKSENIIVKNTCSSESEIKGDAEFQVVILTSPARIPSGSALLKKLPAKYSVKESFDPESGFYSYVVDQQLELMHTYAAYNDMISLGYNDARIRLFTFEDPVEKELHNLKIKYGILTDTYFDDSGKLLTNGILMLNQLAVLLQKYPGTIIEICVHTDNQGNQASNQRLSQARAQAMVDYLSGTGMDGKRLRAKGYGGIKPVVPNTYPTDRRLNRRVEITILAP